jgi:hypothetical protein
MHTPEGFQIVPTDYKKDPRVRELYHPEVGFVQIEASEDPNANTAEVRFLEQSWDTYEATILETTKENFVASLADETMVRQFASIILTDQRKQLGES